MNSITNRHAFAISVRVLVSSLRIEYYPISKYCFRCPLNLVPTDTIFVALKCFPVDQVYIAAQNLFDCVLHQDTIVQSPLSGVGKGKQEIDIAFSIKIIPQHRTKCR